MDKNITKLLIEWSENRERQVLDQLLPLVYDELRRLAASYLRRESAAHTLQPTALVHEAYFKLIDAKAVSFQSRAQFFALTAKMMRNILINHAEGKRAEKRGGGKENKVSLAETTVSFPELNLDVLALNEALIELSGFDSEKGQIVELKFFGGLTTDETAEVIGKSPATIEREWAFARGWLYQKLKS